MDTQNLVSAPTRRNLFTGLAGLTASSVIAWDRLHDGAAHLDGELLASVERFAAADREGGDSYHGAMEAIEAMGLPQDEEVGRKAAVFQALLATDRACDLMLHEIACQPARTQDGMVAKARVVQRWIGDGWEVLRVPTTDPWERVAWSLAQDLLRQGGVA